MSEGNEKLKTGPTLMMGPVFSRFADNDRCGNQSDTVVFSALKKGTRY